MLTDVSRLRSHRCTIIEPITFHGSSWRGWGCCAAGLDGGHQSAMRDDRAARRWPPGFRFRSILATETTETWVRLSKPPGREPYAGKPRVRICAGGARYLASLPRPNRGTAATWPNEPNAER